MECLHDGGPWKHTKTRKKDCTHSKRTSTIQHWCHSTQRDQLRELVSVTCMHVFHFIMTSILPLKAFLHQQWMQKKMKKESFYAELGQVMSSIPRHDKILLIRDFNARVGKDANLWGGVIGREGIGKCNSNGQISLCRILAEHQQHSSDWKISRKHLGLRHHSFRWPSWRSYNQSNAWSWWLLDGSPADQVHAETAASSPGKTP